MQKLSFYHPTSQRAVGGRGEILRSLVPPVCPIPAHSTPLTPQK